MAFKIFVSETVAVAVKGHIPDAAGALVAFSFSLVCRRMKADALAQAAGVLAAHGIAPPPAVAAAAAASAAPTLPPNWASTSNSSVDAGGSGAAAAPVGLPPRAGVRADEAEAPRLACWYSRSWISAPPL
jgi:hypothetical protein